MNTGWITKNHQAEIKGIDVSNRMIEGYYSVFDFKDSDGDIMVKGCYAKTIKENGPSGKDRIMHLYQHDPLTVLGKPTALMEDEKGLYFRTQISDTELGNDVLNLYRDGVLKEHSVGINFVQRDYSNEDEAHIVREVKLWEGSTVTWGANEMALGSIAKGESKDIIDQYKRFSKAYYDGSYTDHTFMLIEKQIEHLESEIRKSLQGMKPGLSTSENEADEIADVFKQFNLELNIKEEFDQWKV